MDPLVELSGPGEAHTPAGVMKGEVHIALFSSPGSAGTLAVAVKRGLFRRDWTNVIPIRELNSLTVKVTGIVIEYAANGVIRLDTNDRPALERIASIYEQEALPQHETSSDSSDTPPDPLIESEDTSDEVAVDEEDGWWVLRAQYRDPFMGPWTPETPARVRLTEVHLVGGDTAEALEIQIPTLNIYVWARLSSIRQLGRMPPELPDLCVEWDASGFPGQREAAIFVGPDSVLIEEALRGSPGS